MTTLQEFYMIIQGVHRNSMENWGYLQPNCLLETISLNPISYTHRLFPLLLPLWEVASSQENPLTSFSCQPMEWSEEKKQKTVPQQQYVPALGLSPQSSPASSSSSFPKRKMCDRQTNYEVKLKADWIITLGQVCLLAPLCGMEMGWRDITAFNLQ